MLVDSYCGAFLINRVNTPSGGGYSVVCSSVGVYSVNLDLFACFLGSEYIIFVTGIRAFVIVR